jgi:hypothetical protein
MIRRSLPEPPKRRKKSGKEEERRREREGGRQEELIFIYRYFFHKYKHPLLFYDEAIRAAAVNGSEGRGGARESFEFLSLSFVFSDT